MWSPNVMDLEKVDLVLDNQKMIQSSFRFEPNPYIFTKIENGKKMAADSSSLSPPSWLLLDHSIAVIWTMFSLSPTINSLSIDDLKWAYEFLKRIKNKKGHNPPDVKVCLKEIQDQLINLYAKLTSMKEVDFDEIAAAFGEKIIEDSTTSYFNTSFLTSDQKLDTLSISSARNPLTLAQKKDSPSTGNAKNFGNSINSKTYTVVDKADGADPSENATGDDEVEKYVLSLFENDEKKDDNLQRKGSSKNLLPMKAGGESGSSQEETATTENVTKEKTKRVQCVAEVRSLKVHKSMKVKDKNGEEAAYSNLKAEVQRLTINPNVSKHEVLKFVQDWGSEQTKRIHTELKRLSSIEEFMKRLDFSEQLEPKLRQKSTKPEKRITNVPDVCLVKKK